MIRIRRIYTTTLPSDSRRVAEVQEIFRQNFSEEPEYAAKIPGLLDHPLRYGYRAVLLVAETMMGKVRGFALILHFPELNFSWLDYLAVSKQRQGGGLGGVLFGAAREYCRDIDSRGMYLEVLPDDPQVVVKPEELKINRQRLRFYENYGLRPIIGTAYETPLGDWPAPYLLFDGLGRSEPLGADEAAGAARLILKRKYGHLVTPDYIETVVESFEDDPVRFRPPRYVRQELPSAPVASHRLARAFALVASAQHSMHYVHDRGYVERPARVDTLLSAAAATRLFDVIEPRRHRQDAITAVHAVDFVNYLRNCCEKLSPQRPVYPYVFPIRRPERRPRDLAIRAGYYCIDTFTPLDGNAYRAARAAVDVALTAADEVLSGRPLAYAVCRPPGHHAERRVFGGFCYFNNSAIAAHQLSAQGKVALLDVDFHHGNGAQDIFYRRRDVLTISIHGHPNYAYPYFSGFADETGADEGLGYNRNYPLPENADDKAWLAAVERGLRRLERFRPDFLVVSIGFDTIKGDPTGAFLVTPDALKALGRRLGELALPTLVCQEGGYNLRNLKRGCTAFFAGVAETLTERFP